MYGEYMNSPNYFLYLKSGFISFTLFTACFCVSNSSIIGCPEERLPPILICPIWNMSSPL